MSEYDFNKGFFVLVLAVIVSIAFFLWKQSRTKFINKTINSSLEKSQYDFNCNEIINDELVAYKKLPLIRNSFIDRFIINGVYRGENFTYFQTLSNLREYSV